MRLNRFWLIALVGLMSFGVATSFQVSAANTDTKTAKTSNAPAKTTTKVEVKKAAKSSKKSKGPHKQTRRTITENRITSNIMSFNQPVAMVDNTNMEVSCDY